MEGERSKPSVPPQRQATSKTQLLASHGKDHQQQQQHQQQYDASSGYLFTPFSGKVFNNVVSGTPRMLKMMSAPITGEEEGGSGGVWIGLSTFILIGCVIGYLLPENEQLPTPWYRTVSSCIGYAYFVCWAVSFYPQAHTNFRRKTTVGLSADFCALNVLGFACYSVYNVALFFSHAVQYQYRRRHGSDSEITVQSNDVAFALHAFLLSSITLCQIGYYDGFHDRISKQVGTILLVLMFVIIFSFGLVVSTETIQFLDFLYLLSYIKILITLLKYMPQIILNFRRKSTHGFSIWQILLDFSGGLLSIAQLVLDCLDLNDWSGLTGNLAKFLLGAVSVVFDSIIMIQHYVWFPTSSEDESRVSHDRVVEVEEPSWKHTTNKSSDADRKSQHADNGVRYYRSMSR